MEYNFIRSLDHDYWNNTDSHRISKTFEQNSHIFQILQNYFSIVENPTSNDTNLQKFKLMHARTSIYNISHYNFSSNSFPNEVEEFNPRLNIKHTKLLFPSSRGKLERMTGKRVAPSKKQDFSRRYTSLRTAAVSIVAESRNDPIAIFHRVNATLQALATLFRFFFSFFSSPCVASIIRSHTCSSFSRLID